MKIKRVEHENEKGRDHNAVHRQKEEQGGLDPRRQVLDFLEFIM